MSDMSEFCELLMVEVECKIHVVEAPTNEANVGDLVSFINGNVPTLGKVVDKMWCEKNGDAYRCVSLIKNIQQLDKIYCPRWEKETN